jgi:hypothetical protein
MFRKYVIARAIENLCSSPHISLLAVSGDGATISNCTIDGSGEKIAKDQARLIIEAYKSQLETIRVLASKI